jgi:hypothetical protein
MNAHEKGMCEMHRILFDSSDSTFLLDNSDLEDAIRAYLEASGMVMVPKTATTEMMQAGKRQRNAKALFDENDAFHVWSAMLDAAPSPFSQANTEGEGND